MRLVTSCPACNTRFHVTAEQLAAHAGEVRCGQCQHLFNVRSALYKILEPQTLPPMPAATSESATDSPPIAEKAVEDIADIAANGDHTDTLMTEDIPGDVVAISPAGEDHSVEELSGMVELPPAVATETNHGESVDTDTEEPAAAEIVIPAETETVLQSRDSQHTTFQQSPVTPTPASTSFLAPEKPARRLPLWVTISLSLLLLLMLIAQSAYFFRTHLAGYWPTSRPLLEAACQHLGCSVPLPRNSELLALDDSDLQEDFEHPDVIQLSTRLLNNAPYAQDYPLLELTLTDDNDKPKLRRSFTPEEYLPSGTNIKAGLPAKQEIQITLAFSTSGETVSGYRVFVTY